jgi:hypothetical protein
MRLLENFLELLGIGVKKVINIERQEGFNQGITQELLALKNRNEVSSFLTRVVPPMNREARGNLRAFLTYESKQAYKEGNHTKGLRLKEASDLIDKLMRFQNMLDEDWKS